MLVAMVSLRRATLGDLPFLMALEEETCRQGFTGKDSLEEHQGCLADEEFVYWIVEAANKAAGFAILAGVGSENRSVLIKRIAMAEPGKGVGREAMRQIIRMAFTSYRAHRLWLDVYPENERARRLYRSLGFQEEGVMRDCIVDRGQFRSLILMSLLEGEAGAMGESNA